MDGNQEGDILKGIPEDISAVRRGNQSKELP